jgi:hypothetical protein
LVLAAQLFEAALVLLAAGLQLRLEVFVALQRFVRRVPGFRNLSSMPKNWFFAQTTASCGKNSIITHWFLRKIPIFPTEIAKNCEHNIDPRQQWH